MNRSANALPMWIVYDRPADYPQHVVARQWLVLAGRLIATNDILIADDLEALREQLPPGLIPLARNDIDPPSVVETWL